MKMVLTGAGSFIGTELIKQALHQEIEVIGIDAVAFNRRNMHIIDIRDRNLASTFPERPDVVVHLAAVSRDGECRRDPTRCFDVNVTGTVNVFEAAKGKGAGQFVFASTEWVYDNFDPMGAKHEDDPIDFRNLTSEYALSKLMAEAALHQQHVRSGIPVTVLRFGIVYGPRKDNWSAVEWLLSALVKGEPVTVGSLATARCFIHVSDVARAILGAIGRKGYETFNIQGDQLLRLRDIIDHAGRLLNRAPQVVETAPDKPSVRNVSNLKAKASLVWKPEVDISAGLQSILDYFEWQRRPKNIV